MDNKKRKRAHSSKEAKAKDEDTKEEVVQNGKDDEEEKEEVTEEYKELDQPPPGWPEEQGVIFSSSSVWSIDQAQEGFGFYSNLPATKRQNKLEIRKIPDDDPREPLRGQHGLFAVKNIRKGELINFYTGIITSRKGPVESEYVFHWHNSTGQHLRIDAKKLGNETRFINDTRGSTFEANAKAACTYLHEQPAVRIVATRAIKPEEEILIQYGEAYWQADSINNNNNSNNNNTNNNANTT